MADATTPDYGHHDLCLANLSSFPADLFQNYTIMILFLGLFGKIAINRKTLKRRIKQVWGKITIFATCKLSENDMQGTIWMTKGLWKTGGLHGTLSQEKSAWNPIAGEVCM